MADALELIAEVPKQDSLAAQVEQASLESVRPSERVWLALNSLDWKTNKPALMARILTESPWNYAMPMALAIMMTAVEEGANPFTKEIYPISGNISFSVQFKLKKARQIFGDKMGIPSYETVEREWPAGRVIYLTQADKAAKRGVVLAKDPGCKCTLRIGEEHAVQTAWLSEAHVPTPTWNEKRNHMLQVRATDYCLRFIGIGISEPVLEDVETPKIEQGKIAVSK